MLAKTNKIWLAGRYEMEQEAKRQLAKEQEEGAEADEPEKDR